jgi:ABC-type nitrate/sulfonate/bicarbonate transport system substrate-binding protein
MLVMLALISCLALPGVGLAAETGSTATPCTTVQYGSFFKDASYMVAEREGFFTREGLCVTYNQVTGSVQQFDSLLAGKYDVIATALDNVANRIVNQNLPLSMVAGADKGADFALAVNTARGISKVSDLRGKPIIVDAVNSGFVFALRKILAANGLLLENGDYTLVPVGGTALRFQYLQAGQTPAGDPVYATMLIYPFTAQITAPVSIAARFSDYVAPYQTNGLAVTHDYANTHGSTITAFLRAYIKAGYFLYDPANHDRVVADLMAGYGVSQTVAEADYQAAIDPVSGQNFAAKMSKKGMINVVAVRQEFGGFNNPVDPKKFVKPSKGGFYDDTFWKAAVKGTRGDDDEQDDD